MNKKKLFDEALGLGEKDAFQLLMTIAEALRWNIAIPMVGDDEEVPGLIIGKDEYINWIQDCIGDTPIPDKLRKKIID